MTNREMVDGNEYWGMSEEDEFSDLTGDVLSFAEYDPFLQRLLAVPSGQWVSLEQACAGLGNIPDRIEELQRRGETRFFAAWLPSPGAYGDANGYCVILFLDGARHWINTATYYGPPLRDGST